MSKTETAVKSNAVNPVAAPSFKRTKLTAEYVDMKDMGVHSKFLGRFIGSQTGPWVDKTTGEEKTLTKLIFDKLSPELTILGRCILFQDRGLEKAMEDAVVVPGSAIELEYLGQLDLGGGKRVNQYDIFGIDDPRIAQLPKLAATVSPVLHQAA